MSPDNPISAAIKFGDYWNRLFQRASTGNGDAKSSMGIPDLETVHDSRIQAIEMSLVDATGDRLNATFVRIVEPPPRSTLAEIWKEFLSSPCSLIEDASKHSELTAHIDRWQRLKANDSPHAS